MLSFSTSCDGFSLGEILCDWWLMSAWSTWKAEVPAETDAVEAPEIQQALGHVGRVDFGCRGSGLDGICKEDEEAFGSNILDHFSIGMI